LQAAGELCSPADSRGGERGAPGLKCPSGGAGLDGWPGGPRSSRLDECGRGPSLANDDGRALRSDRARRRAVSTGTSLDAAITSVGRASSRTHGILTAGLTHDSPQKSRRNGVDGGLFSLQEAVVQLVEMES
ncbi:hypothetical protein ACHAWF_012900, partial [Thalassiosira exigua]